MILRVLFRIFAVLLLLFFSFLSACGQEGDTKTLRLQVELPSDWEENLDMEVLGVGAVAPYVGTIRVVVGDGDNARTWEFPWGERAGKTGDIDLGDSDSVRVQAVTAGTVIMEGNLDNTVTGGEATIALRESGGFSWAGSLLYPRQDHCAVAVGNTVLVIGGNLDTRVIEEIVPSGNGFAASAYAASLIYPRTGQVVLHDAAGGNLFIFKGTISEVEDNLFEFLDLENDENDSILLTNYRRQFSPVIEDREVFLLGGYNSGSEWQEAALLIDAENLNEKLSTIVISLIIRDDPCCLEKSQKIICLGGGTEIIEVFDLVSREIYVSADSFPEIQNFSLISLNSPELIVIGGNENTTPKKEILKFDVPSAVLTLMSGELVYPRFFHTSTLVGENQILVIGGSPNLASSRSAEILDLTTGQSRELPWRMRVPRTGHTATLLADGRVLVIGGNMGEKTIEVWNPPAEY